MVLLLLVPGSFPDRAYQEEFPSDQSSRQMTIRITTSRDDEVTTIRVGGRLNDEAVPDLQRAVKLASAPLRLDLADLISADCGTFQVEPHAGGAFPQGAIR